MLVTLLGNGLALVQELKDAGAHVIAITRSVSDELKECDPQQLIKDIDVTDNEAIKSLSEQIDGPIDVVSTHKHSF